MLHMYPNDINPSGFQKLFHARTRISLHLRRNGRFTQPCTHIQDHIIRPFTFQSLIRLASKVRPDFVGTWMLVHSSHFDSSYNEYAIPRPTIKAWRCECMATDISNRGRLCYISFLKRNCCASGCETFCRTLDYIRHRRCTNAPRWIGTISQVTPANCTGARCSGIWANLMRQKLAPPAYSASESFLRYFLRDGMNKSQILQICSAQTYRFVDCIGTYT